MKLACLLFTALVFASPALAQKAETMTIKVFFHPDKLDPDVMECSKVAPVSRTIPKTRGVATAALLELFKGPTAEEAKAYSGYGPPATNGILKRVKIKNGAAFVNFTKRMMEQMGNTTSSCGSGFYAMLDATLMQFPTVKKVYYAIEGSTNEFYEWVQVGPCPYSKKICASSNF